MSSERKSVSPSRRGKHASGVKMVKQEKMYDKDIEMANAYGGDAVPRVRMIPKRFTSNLRERQGKVLRESSILSPSMINHEIS